MCLSVYLGSHKALLSQCVDKGALGIEKAKWTPPALSGFPFTYYLGRNGEGDELECSCLLAQHVEWGERGPNVCLDDLFSKAPSCPFKELRGYVETAQQTGSPVTLVCDDTGGSPQECSDQDYEHLVISPEMIGPTSYLFADPMASFPWRVFYVTAPKSIAAA
ncbi:hypothetical protein N9L47_13430 [Rhodobacteraceae bacterium]|nr:hypothetical protein [Paracoccaceae bacterium]